MRRLLWLLPAFALLALPARGGAPEWTLEGAFGYSAVLNAPLTIHQAGQPDLHFTAHYEGRPFESPPFYILRLGRWQDGRAWEVEFQHQKLYLVDRPPEVGSFSISHGYNVLSGQRAWERGRTIYRLGAGIVASHPESVVRGRQLDPSGGVFGTGYYVSGPALVAGIGPRWPIGRRWFVHWNVEVTAAWTRVPISGGDAEGATVSVNLLAGLGRRFPARGTPPP